MQRDGQHHHGRAGELTFWALGLLASEMQVWNQMVKRQQNKTPNQKPKNAGTNESFPIAADCSIAGIRRLQMEAATITPAAKPANERCTRSPSDFFHEEHAGRAGRCAKKWDEYAKKRLHRVSFRGYLFLR